MIWEGERCLFGKGWLDFVQETNLQPGDTLVLFDCHSEGIATVHTVIFKGRDAVDSALSGNKVNRLNTIFKQKMQ